MENEKKLTAIVSTVILFVLAPPSQRKDHITLSRMAPTQRKLAGVLEIASAPKG